MERSAAEQNRIVIIGAGASGLVAAIFAGRAGAAVTVLEKNKKPGEKLLRTGNGHCNLTNHGHPEAAYDSDFASDVLRRFSVQETLLFFDGIGLAVRERDGWVYPYNEEAQSVLDCLLQECRRLSVTIHTNTAVVGIEKSPEGFLVRTPGWIYEADRVIFACGSPAGLKQQKAGTERIPQPYDIVPRPGHNCIPIRPALVGLRTGIREFRNIAGIRARAAVTLCVDGVPVDRERGQIQFTAKGISGICVMNLSIRAVRELDEGHKVSLVLDFLGGENHDSPDAAYIRAHLSSLLPSKLLAAVAPEPYAHTDEELVRLLTAFEVPITGSLSMVDAQAASGGIDTSEVNPAAMESKLVPGLFFTGEMLDVTGKCGGWNLQFAWSTGAIAGSAAGGGQTGLEIQERNA